LRRCRRKQLPLETTSRTAPVSSGRTNVFEAGEPLTLKLVVSDIHPAISAALLVATYPTRRSVYANADRGALAGADGLGWMGTCSATRKMMNGRLETRKDLYGAQMGTSVSEPQSDNVTLL
jgi:hypothetical protein